VRQRLLDVTEIGWIRQNDRMVYETESEWDRRELADERKEK